MFLSDLMRRSADDPTTFAASAHDPIIAGLTLDLREVKPGYLFAALAGSREDGASFVADAAARGATAILAAPEAQLPPLDPAIAIVRDANPRRRLALMAAAFAGTQPGTIAAVTGTNGKSSTVHFLRQIWAQLGEQAASVGTLGIVSPMLNRGPGLTTPDPVRLHTDLAALARGGVTHLAIEASSHGLDQHRLDGLKLSAAAFTNLTHEHLDYHVSMDIYFAAKARLFDVLLPSAGTAVVNADFDRAGLLAAICRRRSIRFWTYGARGREFQLERVVPTASGQHLEISVLGASHEIELPTRRRLPGVKRAGGPWVGGCDRRRSGARGGGTGDAERRAGPARTGGARFFRGAGLCRLRPQARGARDGVEHATPLRSR